MAASRTAPDATRRARRSAVTAVLMRPKTKKMIDTEQLILEVKKREILWNSTSKRFMDKYSKRKSWEEVALAFNPDYEDLTPAEKDEIVESIMRKWRNVRDYYIKARKKNARGTSAGGRKSKKYQNYEKLSFLNPILKERRSSVLRRARENTSDEDEMVEEYLELPSDDTMSFEQYNYGDSNESFSANNSRTIKEDKKGEATPSKSMTSFENHMMSADVTQEEDKIKANRNFLLSLLPDVSSLNERQNMRFRLGVLNLLNDIKFEPK